MKLAFAIACMLSPLAAIAAELTVMSGGAVKSAFADAAAAWAERAGTP